MKHLLFIVLLTHSILLNAKDCTEDQIAKMIQQNISQNTIDTICKTEEKKTNNDKQVIVNITNTPVNTNTNMNTNTNTNGSNENTITDNREYFFWRVGLGKMSIKDLDFSETAMSFGIQYFTKGLKDEGFGIGYSSSFASKDMQETNNGYNYNYYYYNNSSSYTLDVSTSELEILYNLKLGNGFSLTPAYIIGSMNVKKKGDSFTTIASESHDLKGFGAYLNFPSIVKSGQGVSLFIKKLSVDTYKHDITIAGLQFTW